MDVGERMKDTFHQRTLRPAKAAEKLGIGLSTLWLKAKTDPDFPKPFKFSARTTVFFEHELDAYQLACAARSRRG
jgi:prophage regulatory protein